MVVVAVCGVILWRLRAAPLAIIALLLGVLIAFWVACPRGINANILSVGGIAGAIGAKIDLALVMIENADEQIEAWLHAHLDRRCRAKSAGE